MKKKQPRYALISVFDKKGIKPFAKGLEKHGFKIIASGGTFRELKKAGVKVIEVSKITKFPEMMDGRVKTLHPKIHGGLLALRDDPSHMKMLSKYGIPQIDMVVINLYPFEKVVARKKFTHEEAIENIDIGGPAMIRAASKNYRHVSVVTSPDQYDRLLKELGSNSSVISLATNIELQREAFLLTGRYDAAISAYLSPVKDTESFPKEMMLKLEKEMDLRYGENPHQPAAFYRAEGRGLVDIRQLHGKELSFNNILDMEAAYGIVNYFADLTVAIVKHNNPCGVATSRSVRDAYQKALKCDPVSAYGGIIACNREVDEAAAREMFKLFAEVIIAPEFSKAALLVLCEKKNLRLVKCPADFNRSTRYDFKKVAGGFLVQEADRAELTISDIRTVTKKQPSLKEIEDLFFAWGISKFVKSNAIVLAKNGATVGIGAGQPNRVGSANIALEMAGSSCFGAVMASDGFFPFADSVELAKKHRISAIIQPGGSIRDEEVIKAADKNKMVMLFTGRRHFKH